MKRMLRAGYAIAAVISLVGCVGDAPLPMDPERLPPSYSLGSEKTLVELDSALVADTSGAWIGPDGGRVEVGRIKLRVPQGALSDSTYIEVRVHEGTELRVEFAPHGLKFNAGYPADLEIKYHGAITPDESTYEVVYLEPSSDGISLIITEILKTIVEPIEDKVEAKIEHFSQYAVAAG